MNRHEQIGQQIDAHDDDRSMAEGVFVRCYETRARSLRGERVKGRKRGASRTCHVQVGDESERRHLELFFAQVSVLANAGEEPHAEPR